MTEPQKNMRTREEAARFVEKQMHWSHECRFNKGNKANYGWQELRELMDFIYDAEPTEAEKLDALPHEWKPTK
jgi:hypothetical protein